LTVATRLFWRSCRRLLASVPVVLYENRKAVCLSLGAHGGANAGATPRRGLGNAAHTLHPVAGQGFNLCLRDCLALTERIVQRHREGGDIGEFALLHSYEQSRLQDQHNVTTFSDRLVRGFSNNTPGLTLARNLGMVTFDLLPAAKQALARYAMGLNH
jgi:hypothetical protein